MYCDVSLQDMDTSLPSIPVSAKGNKGVVGAEEAPGATTNAAKGDAAGAGAGAGAGAAAKAGVVAACA